MGNEAGDDGSEVRGKIERTIPVRISLDETFDIAEDTGTPVVEDYVNRMPFHFTGTLNKFVITLAE
jgi:arylsulfatase